MEYLSNDYIYHSQPEYINSSFNTDNDGKYSNLLTDEQIAVLLEPYENKYEFKYDIKNILLFLFLIFFFLIFGFLIF